MTKRILNVLIAIGFVLFAHALPSSAQEPRLGVRTQGNARVMTMTEVEQYRSDLLTAYAESEALIKLLAGHEFLRQSAAMGNYESVIKQLDAERARVAAMTEIKLMQEAQGMPDPKSLKRVIELARSTRTDAKFLEVIRKAERYEQTNLLSQHSASAGKANAREAVAVPSYIPPICNHDDPSNYPSGADIAISNAVALALHALANALPGTLGFFVGVPNPIVIALVVAAYAVDQVTNALQAVAADAVYCESTRLYIEDNLVNDDGFTALLISNDFYLTYVVKAVKSSMAKATAKGIPTNCGVTRLNEALTYFTSDVFSGASGADRVSAYNKLRSAYQNIGASACVP